MKVRLLIEVDDYARFVIAGYYGARGDQARPRGTRQQVRRFVQAALRLSVREQAEALTGKRAATARKLRDKDRPSVAVEEIVPPRDRQREFSW